jgi:predicted Zn-ribbon and HTH transcriptional regulator
MQKMELMKLYEFIYLAYNFREQPTPQEIDYLYPLFEKYTYKEIKAAAEQHIHNMVTAPKPAHLIKLAEKNRQQRELLQAAEKAKTIRYDSEGRQIYNCPYCKDSGYMIVDDDEIYSPSATRCICQNPIKKLELEQNGRVRLILKSAHRRSDNYYVFDFAKGIFVPEDKIFSPRLSATGRRNDGFDTAFSTAGGRCEGLDKSSLLMAVRKEGSVKSSLLTAAEEWKLQKAQSNDVNQLFGNLIKKQKLPF